MSLQKNMSKISKTEISIVLVKLNEKMAQPELCDFKTVRNKLIGVLLNQGKLRNQTEESGLYATGNSKPFQSPKQMKQNRRPWEEFRSRHGSLKSIPALCSTYLYRFNRSVKSTRGPLLRDADFDIAKRFS